MGLPGAGAIIGGLIAGLGVSSLFGKKQGSSNYDSYSSVPYQSAIESIPTMPETPVAEDGSKSDAVLAAEEEERKKRAAQAEASKTNYTGGLGLTTPANVQRNTLLG